VTALSLSAVGCFQGKGRIAFSAYFLIAVEFLGNGGNGGVHNTSSQSQHQMKSGLFLDVVIGQASSV